jgi:hypothetical protein
MLCRRPAHLSGRRPEFFSDSGKFGLVDLESKIVYNLREISDFPLVALLPQDNRKAARRPISIGDTGETPAG